MRTFKYDEIEIREMAFNESRLYLGSLGVDGAFDFGSVRSTLGLLAFAGIIANIGGVLGIGIAEPFLFCALGVLVTSGL